MKTKVSTVEQIKATLSKREVEAAENARDLQAALGYPSIATLMRTIQQGAIKTSVTGKDIRSALKIMGPPLPMLQGKSQDEGANEIRLQEKLLFTPKIENLDADIFYITTSLMFLITVGHFMDYTHVIWIASRTENDLAAALRSVGKDYEDRGHEINECYFDGESAIKSLKEHNSGKTQLNFRLVQRASHKAGKAERKIRTLKNTVRSLVFDVPFYIYGQLIVFLVLHAVNLINLMVTKTSPGQSPHTSFWGTKPSIEDVAPHKWGTTGFLVTPVPESQRNLISIPRGKSVMYVGTSRGGVSAGGNQYLDLEMYTGSICTVNVSLSNRKFTSIPMTEQQVEAFVNLAQGNVPYQVPNFYYHNGKTVPHEEPEEETVNLEDYGEGLMQPEQLSGTNATLVAAPDSTSSIIIDDNADDKHAKRIERANRKPKPSAKPNLNHRGAKRSKPKAAPTSAPNLEEPVTQALPQLATGNHRGDMEDNDSPVTTQGRYNTRRNDYQAREALRRGQIKAYAAKTFVNDQRKVTQKMLDEISHDTLQFSATIDASLKEIQQLHRKQVFHGKYLHELTKRQRKKLLKTSMLVKDKFSPTGSFIKTKGRFVTGGHRQDRTLYTKDDTTAPTVSHTGVMVVICLAALENRHVCTIDIGGAFLNADMPQDPQGDPVHIELDKLSATLLCEIAPEYKEFLNDDGTLVCQLDKALYGCVESARAWYLKLMADLKELGFEPNPNDPCVLNAMLDGNQVTIAVHVDDLLITSQSLEALRRVEDFLNTKYSGEINAQHGKVHEYLGMILDFTFKGCVRITMPKITDDILDGITGNADTPASENLFDIDLSSEPLDDNRSVIFHSKVASLLYLGKRVRPDLLLAVSFLSTRVNRPLLQDWLKLQRVLKYLNRTRLYDLWLQPDEDVSVFAYVDASYASHADAKGHAGIFVTMGKGPIFVKSAKHKIVSKSSTEAEFISMASAVSEVVWIRDFLQLQGYDMGPALVYQDNQSAMILASRAKTSSERTKHISVRYFFIHERIANGEISLQYIRTADMIADVLTKPLTGDTFHRLAALMLNYGSDVNAG